MNDLYWDIALLGSAYALVMLLVFYECFWTDGE